MSEADDALRAYWRRDLLPAMIAAVKRSIGPPARDAFPLKIGDLPSKGVPQPSHTRLNHRRRAGQRELTSPFDITETA